jgi:uncharacterized protein (TIGR00369 family)
VAFGGYPPARHFLNDLGMEAEVTSETTAKVRIRATPHVTGPGGGVRAGVLATLVDVVGGSAALRALQPDWMATADLTLQLVQPVVGPWVEARASVVRRGRTTLVVEALVFDVAEDGTDVLGPDGVALPVAWASMTFAVLPARDSTPVRDLSEELPVRWAFTGSGLDRPVTEVLGISVVDAAAGVVSLPVAEYLHNSFGAVQGGVMATIGEVATAALIGAHSGPDGEPALVTDLQVAYLALGRVGPIVSRSKRFVSDGAGGGSVVVELIDRGADDRLTTVINARAVPVSSMVAGHRR